MRSRRGMPQLSLLTHALVPAVGLVLLGGTVALPASAAEPARSPDAPGLSRAAKPTAVPIAAHQRDFANELQALSRRRALSSWSATGSQTHRVAIAIAIAPSRRPQASLAPYTASSAVAPHPQLDISPTGLNLSAPVGTRSAAQTVTLTNSGNADLHVNSFSTNNSEFTANSAQSCATVAPATGCRISVTFTPTSSAMVFGLLTIRYDDSGTPVGPAVQTVDLTGTATSPDPLVARHNALGGNTGLLGAPVDGEYPVRGGIAQNYVHGRIYYSPATGAHEVHGAILAHYLRLGGPVGVLRLPTSDETAAPANTGRYNTFTAGAIYWSPATDAREVHGAIRVSWQNQGADRSWLGYPTSDEYTTTSGRRSDFQHGYITWTPTEGTTTTCR